jgi:hypothetical protein
MKQQKCAQRSRHEDQESFDNFQDSQQRLGRGYICRILLEMGRREDDLLVY